MAALAPARSLGFFVALVLLLPAVTLAASAPAKDVVTFDHASSLPTSGPALPWSAFEPVPSLSPVEGYSINPSMDQETLATVLAPNQSSVSFGLVPETGVVDGEDDIQRDPRPQMKKFILAALLIGALVRYLTSPSYIKFVREVLDPWDL